MHHPSPTSRLVITAKSTIADTANIDVASAFVHGNTKKTRLPNMIPLHFASLASAESDIQPCSGCLVAAHPFWPASGPLVTPRATKWANWRK